MLLQFKIFEYILKCIIYSYDGKTKFLAVITPVSHDLSEIILMC